LEGSCNLWGRFTYQVDAETGRVDAESGKQSRSYDIIRHALVRRPQPFPKTAASNPGVVP
jgi:hypothetical protein